jgi:hypothetical protein
MPNKLVNITPRSLPKHRQNRVYVLKGGGGEAPNAEAAPLPMANALEFIARAQNAANAAKEPESGALALGEVLVDIIDPDIAGNIDTNFHTPEQLRDWFKEGNNYYKFIYGIGRILKAKESVLKRNASNLQQQSSQTNRDYDTGIVAIDNMLPMNQSFSQSDMIKKSKLVEKITDDINDGYKNQFFELLQKQLRYTETIDKINSRKAFIVYLLNEKLTAENQEKASSGRELLIEKNIMPLAEKIYEQYRGERYTAIRSFLFSMIKIIANNPEIIEDSFIMNTSITGPAGSGKTTMARLLARWYNVIGLLCSDMFLDNPNEAYREVGKPELVGQYLGQTAPRTQGVLYASLEKTLFIDEAYSVAGCAFDKRTGELQPDSYGEEFVATLLPYMANHKGIGAVIVAGYKNLMNLCFFERNEGLPRRFPCKIDLPLYSTDELYVMFLRNIIDRQLSSLKLLTRDEKLNIERTKDLKAQTKISKQLFYLGIKPAFMMFHYDTSYNGVELLRKYLLLFEIIKSQENPDGVKKEVPTHSYTITNHVLTCLLGKPLRRNILRYFFYDKAFKFKQQNLSFFPAQAGEMGLLADMTNKSVEIELSEKRGKLENQNFIHLNQEVLLFNNYFLEKGAELRYIKSEAKEGQPEKIFAEIVKRGIAPGDFQQTINNILITTVFPGGLPSLKELFESILSNDAERARIFEAVLKKYIEIARVVIPELIKTKENDFPVNMLHSDVLVEQTILLGSGGPAKGFFEEESKLFLKFVNSRKEYIGEDKYILKHDKFDTDEKYAKWEDLGFY